MFVFNVVMAMPSCAKITFVCVLKTGSFESSLSVSLKNKVEGDDKKGFIPLYIKESK